MELLQQVVAWLAVLIVLALALRQGFEDLISKPIVEKLVGAKGHPRLQAVGDFLKGGQAYLVLLAGLAFCFVLPIDLTTSLNSIVEILPKGELTPETLNVINGVIVAIGALGAHGVIRFQTGKVKLFGG